MIKIKYNKERENKYDEFIEQLQNRMEDSIISYDKINPSILAFHDNDILFSIISTDENNEILNQVNKYFNLLSFNLGEKTKSKIKTPRMLEEEGKLLDEILKIITDDEKIIKTIKDIVKEKFKDYAFTSDNFIKMFLLIMRIRAGIPTILMGETGCGKTHLINMFSLLYGKNLDNIYTLKFHAGITDKDINDFIKKTIDENNIKETKEIENIKKEVDQICLEESNNEEKKKNEMNIFVRFFYKNFNSYKGYNKEEFIKFRTNDILNRKIIIFFDEINTCNCLGLIKHLMCDNNYRKINKIPERFIFICACNPYRILSKENQKLQFGLNLRNSKKRKLVYTVNPLPFSLLNFVLDFKDLSKETTKKYIEVMIKKMIKKNDYIDIIEKLLEKSHLFIKEKSDISSVSLREINRFGKMYNFFYEYLKKKEIKNQKNKEKNAIILSLYFCYYLKLPTTDLRKKYLTEIENIENLNFEEITERESLFITEQILKGKKGYAKNKALRENLFCEFICLINKEPLIICGKPGASKSLSVRLLLDAMRGKSSSNEFFKQFDEVIPSFYQCSITSTSESVQNVFNRAREKLKKNKYPINSLVFMDEMGIADESKNNPLKVLHSELDKNLEFEEKKNFFYWY